MQDEHIGFWSFPIFSSIALDRKQTFHTFKLLLKNIWKNQVLKLICLLTLKTKHRS